MNFPKYSRRVEKVLELGLVAKLARRGLLGRRRGQRQVGGDSQHCATVATITQTTYVDYIKCSLHLQTLPQTTFPPSTLNNQRDANCVFLTFIAKISRFL